MQTIVKDYNGSIVDGPFGSNLKTSDYVETGVPVLQGKNVTNDRFLWSDVRYITNEKAKELSRSSVRVGDILMVKIGSVGYSAIVDNLNNFDFAIIPANLLKIDIDESKAVTKYVHHYMTSPEGKRRIVDEASSTAQPALSLGTMKKFRLPIPPLPEQKKIASILTSVDEVIENTQKQIDKLQDLKKATMNELLTKGIGHTEFKDSELGRIPKSWEVMKLDQLCSLKYGKSPKEIEVKDGKYSIYGTGGVVGKTNSFVHLGESIVIGRKGSIDNVSFVRSPFWAIDTTYYVEGKGTYMKWLFYRLQFEGLRKYNEASGVPSLNRDTLYGIRILTPTKVEQTEICVVLDSISSQIHMQSKKLVQTQSLKKSLMQDLLTGKVRVSVN